MFKSKFYQLPNAGLKEAASEFAFTITTCISALAIFVLICWFVPELAIFILCAAGIIGALTLIFNVAWVCSYKFLQRRGGNR